MKYSGLQQAVSLLTSARGASTGKSGVSSGKAGDFASLLAVLVNGAGRVSSEHGGFLTVKAPSVGSAGKQALTTVDPETGARAVRAVRLNAGSETSEGDGESAGAFIVMRTHDGRTVALPVTVSNAAKSSTGDDTGSGAGIVITVDPAVLAELQNAGKETASADAMADVVADEMIDGRDSTTEGTELSQTEETDIPPVENPEFSAIGNAAPAELPDILTQMSGEDGASLNGMVEALSTDAVSPEIFIVPATDTALNIEQSKPTAVMSGGSEDHALPGGDYAGDVRKTGAADVSVTEEENPVRSAAQDTKHRESAENGDAMNEAISTDAGKHNGGRTAETDAELTENTRKTLNASAAHQKGRALFAGEMTVETADIPVSGQPSSGDGISHSADTVNLPSGEMTAGVSHDSVNGQTPSGVDGPSSGGSVDTGGTNSHSPNGGVTGETADVDLSGFAPGRSEASAGHAAFAGEPVSAGARPESSPAPAQEMPAIVVRRPDGSRVTLRVADVSNADSPLARLLQAVSGGGPVEAVFTVADGETAGQADVPAPETVSDATVHTTRETASVDAKGRTAGSATPSVDRQDVTARVRMQPLENTAQPLENTAQDASTTAPADAGAAENATTADKGGGRGAPGNAVTPSASRTVHDAPASHTNATGESSRPGGSRLPVDAASPPGNMDASPKAADGFTHTETHDMQAAESTPKPGWTEPGAADGNAVQSRRPVSVSSAADTISKPAGKDTPSQSSPNPGSTSNHETSLNTDVSRSETGQTARTSAHDARLKAEAGTAGPERSAERVSRPVSRNGQRGGIEPPVHDTVVRDGASTESDGNGGSVKPVVQDRMTTDAPATEHLSRGGEDASVASHADADNGPEYNTVKQSTAKKNHQAADTPLRGKSFGERILRNPAGGRDMPAYDPAPVDAAVEHAAAEPPGTDESGAVPAKDQAHRPLSSARGGGGFAHTEPVNGEAIDVRPGKARMTDANQAAIDGETVQPSESGADVSDPKMRVEDGMKTLDTMRRNAGMRIRNASADSRPEVQAGRQMNDVAAGDAAEAPSPVMRHKVSQGSGGVAEADAARIASSRNGAKASHTTPTAEISTEQARTLETSRSRPETSAGGESAGGKAMSAAGSDAVQAAGSGGMDYSRTGPDEHASGSDSFLAAHSDAPRRTSRNEGQPAHTDTGAEGDVSEAPVRASQSRSSRDAGGGDAADAARNFAAESRKAATEHRHLDRESAERFDATTGEPVPTVTADQPAQPGMNGMQKNTHVFSPLAAMTERGVQTPEHAVRETASEGVGGPDAPAASMGQTAASESSSPAAEKMVSGAAGDYRAEMYDEMMGTIVRHARLMTHRGQSSAVIRLEPPSLGRLKLEIVTERSKVTGKITVDSHEVRDVIQHRMAELRETLAQNGLKVERFDVQVGHNGGTDQWARREQFEGFGGKSGRTAGRDGVGGGSSAGGTVENGPMEQRRRAVLNVTALDIVA